MQSEEDSLRIAGMGAPEDKILMAGNIKFDRSLVTQETSEGVIRDLDAGFRLSSAETPLIVAGSTHAGEEEILLEVLGKIRQVPGLSRTRLLLAPRHPERFAEVADRILRHGFTIRKRTDSAAPDNGADVLLLDSLGELAAAYQFATAVFVGGTLIRHGGHSIMEPALYSKAIVVGPSMHNFREIAEKFLEHGGIRQITAGEENRKLQIEQLTASFENLLLNEEEREKTGKAAFSILEKNRGAARATAEQIALIFGQGQENASPAAKIEQTV